MTATPTPAAETPTGDPQAVVQSFYDWWLDQAQGRPSDRGDFRGRPELSPAFIQEVSDGGPYPLDRFLCAQAIPDRVDAGEATIDGLMATVIITLVGLDATTPVELVYGPDGWQISNADCGFEPPTSGPSAAPSVSPGESQLGTDTLLFHDDFQRPGSGWTVGDGMGASSDDSNGVLSISISQEASGFTPGRSLGSAFELIRFAALLEPQPGDEGIYGAICIDEDREFIGGSVTTGGSYFLHRQVAGVDEVIERYDEPALIGTAPGSEVTVMVECAVGADGTVDVYFSVNGELLQHHTESGSSLGPVAEVGLYVGAETSAFRLIMKEATAWVASGDR